MTPSTHCTKNIQVIDSALNCTYEIFSLPEEYFQLMFPGDGQDIEFIDDFIERVGEEVALKILDTAWKNRINKKMALGVHGTLFFELAHKKKYYPTKRESEMIP